VREDRIKEALERNPILCGAEFGDRLRQGAATASRPTSKVGRSSMSRWKRPAFAQEAGTTAGPSAWPKAAFTAVPPRLIAVQRSDMANGTCETVDTATHCHLVRPIMVDRGLWKNSGAFIHVEEMVACVGAGRRKCVRPAELDISGADFSSGKGDAALVSLGARPLRPANGCHHRAADWTVISAKLRAAGKSMSFCATVSNENVLARVEDKKAEAEKRLSEVVETEKPRAYRTESGRCRAHPRAACAGETGRGRRAEPVRRRRLPRRRRRADTCSGGGRSAAASGALHIDHTGVAASAPERTRRLA